MKNPHLPPAPSAAAYRPRWWPGLLLVALVCGMMLVPPLLPPLKRTFLLFSLLSFAPVVGLVGAVAWWAGFSRVPRADRIGLLALLFAPLAFFTVEAAVQGVPPFAPLLYGVPVVLLAWVAWLVISLPLPGGVRRVGVYVALIVGWMPMAMLRVDGSDADLVPVLAWRWQPKPEDAFDPNREKTDAPAGAVDVTPGDWAEFRGPNRDNVVRGAKLDADHFADAKEVWRKKIGPGWGSFAVAGGRLFTQEQQGESEAVICLDAASGNLVWEHKYPAKFFELQGGVGPRSTPTVSGGKVYACGATGVLVCLDAAKGTMLWTKNLTDVGGAKPMWGYAVSPLLTHGLVVCYTGGKGGKGVTAFDSADGSVKWQAGQGIHGYSAAQLVTFAGVEQILMQSNYGLESFDPITGKVLWEHLWKLEGGNRTTQPLVLGDGDVVVTTGVGQLASRRLKVTKSADDWAVAQVWQSGELSPYYNDGVVSGRHYYGFSGEKFHCVDLATGEQTWTKWGRYGNGQVLLFAEQNLLLVMEAKKYPHEKGRVFLLKADPDPDAKHELTSFGGLTGKTWNHPAFSRGRLYVRNGQEAACYELK